MSLHSQLLLAVCFLAAFVARSQAVIGTDADTFFIRQNLNSVLINADHTGADSAEINVLQYSENLDALIDVQNGFSLTRRGNYAAEVIHRGMASERVNVTIDGMKVFAACTDKMDPVTSYVSANNLKSLDVESAGESKAYGSNIGGQVNLNSKEALLNEAKRINTNVSLGTNSASNGLQGSFSTNISEEKFAIRLNGMASKHENYRAGGGEVIDYSQYAKTNFGVAIKAKLTEQTFILGSLIKDDAINVGYPALPMDVSRASASIYSMTYRKYFSNKALKKLDVKLYGSNVIHIMDDSQREVVMHMDMPGKSDTYGVLAELNLEPNHRHKMNLVLDGYQNRSLAEMTMYPKNEAEMYMMTWPDVERSILGAYVSDEYSINETYNLTSTFRVDAGYSSVQDDFGKKQLEVFGFNIDGPIYQKAFNFSSKLSKRLGRRNNLSIEMAYSERLPSVSEQFGFYIFNSQDNYDYLGDPFINNEQAYHGELTFELNRKAWSLVVTTFAYHIQNYVFGRVNEAFSAMTIGASGVKEYVNLPYARIYGVETQFSWKVTRNVLFNTGMTYNYGVDNNQAFLPLMAPLTVRSEFIYSFTRNKIVIDFKAASTQTNFNKDAGENRTAAYTIAGISYQRTLSFLNQELNIFAGVENIFDAYYWDHQDWVDLPRQGRNVFLKLQAEF